MGELVDQRQLGRAADDGVDVQLLEHEAPVLDPPSRDRFEPLERCAMVSGRACGSRYPITTSTPPSAFAWWPSWSMR